MEMNPPERTVAIRKKSLQTVQSVPSASFERIEETFDSCRDLVCYSHLRWDFVYQRPQHILTRFAREGRVFYVEEVLYEGDAAALSMRIDKSGVCVVAPRLPVGTPPAAAVAMQKDLLRKMYAQCAIRDCVAWYYTPMARAFTSDLPASVIVYDCMDELSLFRGAPPELKDYEAELMRVADVVFTGGLSLFEAKRLLHPNVHPMPSSIDVKHFKSARSLLDEPLELKVIQRPRIGFAGVIDERMDIDLLQAIAKKMPEWHFVLIGPVVKIDPRSLPSLDNVHYLGRKDYEELPSYLAGWDVAIMPFARNDATRFISPTKTPEYLAAGKPVVSTSIRDVVQTYKATGLVRIADAPAEFIAAIQRSLRTATEASEYRDWLMRADAFLAKTSWDRTWMSMTEQVEKVIASRKPSAVTSSRMSEIKCSSI
jgi:UDP-galactopyranose mutase